MKALIKFLPVEHELIDMIKRKPTLNNIAEEIKETLSGKLFALTQDIKVGDKIFLFDKDQVWDGMVTDKKEKEELKKQGHWYKIVGEVSPKATFVEDGKEYEVQQTIMQTSMKNDPKWKGKEIPMDKAFFNPYTVKCPTCNHYH